MAPRKITDERISRMRASGTEQRSRAEGPTVTVSPSRSTLQPRWRRMATVCSTSVSRGQLWMTQVSGDSRVAHRMGRTLFLAPWMATLPDRG